MHRFEFLLFAALATTAPLAAPVIAAPAANSSIDGRKVATEMAALLSKTYVVPELRSKFVERLNQGISSGRYDTSDREVLLERLNSDLDAVTPDKHLNVADNPALASQLAEPIAGGDDDSPLTPKQIAAAGKLNHGLAQLRLLPGNIRYLETTGFVWAGDESERAYDNAVTFLSGGDAIIIDMRKNGGGSPEAVRYLISHFLPPNKPLMTFVLTTSGETRTATLPKLRAPSLRGKPLYVLTSKGSASAAEEFIGHVKGNALGELIGENSAGAGFRNQFFALPNGFVISISVGQAILASTGKGWEAVGFAPDTVVPVDQALNLAQSRALTRLAGAASPAEKRKYETQAALLLAQVKPVTLELAPAGYAGTYGERTVTVDGGGIAVQRQGGPSNKLVAIGPNLFVYENDGASTLRFDVVNGRAVALHLLREDGSTADGSRTD